MRDDGSATTPRPVAVPRTAARTTSASTPLNGPAGAPSTKPGSGLVLASLGVTCFSLTLPAAAWALEGFGPWSATTLRITVAGVLAGLVLALLRVRPPARRHWPWLAVSASGVVIGFPLLTTLALQTSSASHAAVVVGLLPLTTALYSSLRTGHRPPRLFWAAALTGAACVIAFVLHESGGAPVTGDFYLGGALLLCAAAYGEGGRLARDLPGIQVVGWSLVGCVPLGAAGAVIALLNEPVQLSAHSATGLLWMATGSQLVGLLLWYRGLGAAGVARASQTQLAQPLLTLGWSVLLLGENLSLAAPVTAVAVLICIVVVLRTRA